MIYYYFNGNNVSLFRSLERYFRYVLDSTLKLLHPQNVNSSKDFRILLLNDEKVKEKFRNNFSGLQNYSIILLSLSESNGLNLLQFSEYKNNLKEALNSNLSMPLYTEAELKEKLKNFFKGHGEESILKTLSHVEYALTNYPAYRAGLFTKLEYVNILLSKASKAWRNFIERFNKNRVYLELLGIKENIKELEIIINEICPFLTTFKENVKKDSISETEVKIILDKIKKIDYFLIQISKELKLGDAPIQYSNSRR